MIRICLCSVSVDCKYGFIRCAELAQAASTAVGTFHNNVVDAGNADKDVRQPRLRAAVDGMK